MIRILQALDTVLNSFILWLRLKHCRDGDSAIDHLAAESKACAMPKILRVQWMEGFLGRYYNLTYSDIQKCLKIVARTYIHHYIKF